MPIFCILVLQLFLSHFLNSDMYLHIFIANPKTAPAKFCFQGHLLVFGVQARQSLQFILHFDIHHVNGRQTPLFVRVSWTQPCRTPNFQQFPAVGPYHFGVFSHDHCLYRFLSLWRKAPRCGEALFRDVTVFRCLHGAVFCCLSGDGGGGRTALVFPRPALPAGRKLWPLQTRRRKPGG